MNPCPHCGCQRESLESPCSQCGWAPGSGRTEREQTKRPRFRFGLMGGAFCIIVSAMHGGLTWWALNHTSPGFLIMEGGGNATMQQRVADLLVLILNLPLTIFAWALGVQGYWLLAAACLNSLLWALGILWISRTLIRLAERHRAWRETME